MQQSGDPLRIQVFNTLEDAILNGSYKEGDSLNELRLSKSLGLSLRDLSKTSQIKGQS